MMSGMGRPPCSRRWRWPPARWSTSASHRPPAQLTYVELWPRQYPRRQLHVVLDNYGTHSHAAVQAWLAKLRGCGAFTPTSASWVHLVEVSARRLPPDDPAGHSPAKPIWKPNPPLLGRLEAALPTRCVGQRRPRLMVKATRKRTWGPKH